MAAYSKRYPGGFVDKPSLTTGMDAQWANAVEAALLALFDATPGSAGMVPVWTPGGSHYVPKLITNAEIDPAAAIAKSKLAALNISDADIAAAAAIARSKLDFGSGLTNADLAAAAAIAISKLAGYPGDSAKELRGDGSWGIRGRTLLFDAQVARGSAGDPATGATVIDSNAILGGNISGIYKRLVVEYQVRMTSSNNVFLMARLNNDGSALYDYVYTQVNSGGMTTGGAVAATEIVVNNAPGPTGPANTWASGTLVFDNYTLTDRNKEFRGYGTFSIILGAFYEIKNGGQYRSTNAMTRLHFLLNGGLVFADGSRVSMYGEF